MQIETTSSTAEAAKLSKTQPKTLCIVSSMAINKYKLHSYQKNIEDFSGNNTRFLIIGNMKLSKLIKTKLPF